MRDVELNNLFVIISMTGTSSLLVEKTGRQALWDEFSRWLRLGIRKTNGLVKS